MADATTKVGSGKYQTKVPVDPQAQMICGRTGLNKKFADLTDDDISACVTAGSKFFSLAPVAAPTVNKTI